MPLKLQLHIGDAVTIGDNIVAKVLSTGRTMQIEIAAPRSVKITRIPADLSTYGQNEKRVAQGRPRGGSPRFADDADDNRGNR